jgi:hypothetical protein
MHGRRFDRCTAEWTHTAESPLLDTSITLRDEFASTTEVVVAVTPPSSSGAESDSVGARMKLEESPLQ